MIIQSSKYVHVCSKHDAADVGKILSDHATLEKMEGTVNYV